MRIDKHIEVLREVEDEISAALKDSGGMAKHQRRLAFMISLGIAELVEVYFHSLGIIKEGSRIKHEWFKKKAVKEILASQIIKPIESIRNIDRVISISREIEERRNDLAYSSPVEEEVILKEEINHYFEIKRIIEKEVGGLNVRAG
jgi:hypothetical protein